MKSFSWHLAAIVVIIATALIAYRAALFPANELARYPWGSDTWGHLIKVEFLQQEVAQGKLYPNIFSGWYAGVQLFRYYAPLPYYVLLIVWYIVKDVFLAASWFVFLAALFGGLSFLLFERWIGPFPSALGGFLFTVLPDNVRVAFAEGNLPRVLAMSLLPMAFYLVVYVMEANEKRRRYIILLAIFTSLMVLSHAMMGAIFVASLALFSVIYWLLGGSRSNGLFGSALGLGSGLLLSSWWLLPSLTGGITELNQSAVGEALARFPLSFSFNPFIRLSDKEAFYIGIGLGVGALLTALRWRQLGQFARATLLAALATTLVTTTFFNPLYSSLPFTHLFWPIRFAGFASFTLLLAIMSCWRHSASRHRLALLLVIGIIVVDSWGSSSLMFLREADATIVGAADKLKEMPGWRVATADLSRLGSAPSYWLTWLGKREQVYGWGYQGARIATNVASLNYALDHDYLDYAVDRLEELGVDDVLLMNGVMAVGNLGHRLERQGYRSISLDSRLTLYHRDGAPRAFRVDYDILGIGGGAQNIALLFPKIVLGHSTYVDDYDPAYLTRFKRLILSRFAWKDKNKAERIVTEYAREGGTVVIDLTGVPIDVLSREPKFLGIYGEPIQFVGKAVLERYGNKTHLVPFAPEEGGLWLSHTPQGLDSKVITFDYLGHEGVALGYKNFDGGRVWFTGLNLPYHALLTGDPAAIEIMEEVLDLRAGELPIREAIELQDYRAGEDGYSFSYSADMAGELLVPVAAHEGATVAIDGELVGSRVIDNMVALYGPAGRHQVTLSFQKPLVYTMGLAVSFAALLILLGYATGFPSLVGKLEKRSLRRHAKPVHTKPVEVS